jgi:hypothetical protein
MPMPTYDQSDYDADLKCSDSFDKLGLGNGLPHVYGQRLSCTVDPALTL